MMTDQKVTQAQYEDLVDDAQYLEDEAEALKYVIDNVPYTEVPTGGMSIIQKLALIDHAQNRYYRPLFERISTSNRLVYLKKIDHYTETFDFPEDEHDVQKLLNKIIKHRAALLNLIEKIPLLDWERPIKDGNNTTISLYDFASGMITNERKQLKEIADLVLIYQNHKQANRQTDAKVKQRHNKGE